MKLLLADGQYAAASRTMWRRGYGQLRPFRQTESSREGQQPWSMRNSALYVASPPVTTAW